MATCAHLKRDKVAHSSGEGAMGLSIALRNHVHGVILACHWSARRGVMSDWHLKIEIYWSIVKDSRFLQLTGQGTV